MGHVAVDAPGVSVIIPTYNRGAIVGRAIDSALAAMKPGDELLVVDDGSTDDTPARLERYGERIRYLRSAHVGPGAIRNLGIREARQPLVAFLDSDDEWMPDKLELQRAVMARRPDILFCFTDFGARLLDGREVRRFLSHWHRDPRPWSEILGPGRWFSALAPLPPGRPDFLVHVGDLYVAEMLGDYVCTSTIVVRKEPAGEAFRYAEDLVRYQDWECFGRLSGAGLAAYLDCETQWNCDHAEPRLTHADDLYCETARLAILERVWGSDAAFLSKHGDRYRQIVSAYRRARGRSLLGLGRRREAREEFRRSGDASLIERTLASLPGPLTAAILAARRRLRGRPAIRSAAEAASAGRRPEGERSASA